MAHQPQNLVATAISANAVTLSWDDVDTLTDEVYDIERDGVTVGNDYAGTHSVVAPYTDTGLSADTDYTYRVRAVGGSEVGGPEVPETITGLIGFYDFSDPDVLFTDTGMTTLVSADGNTIKGLNDKSTAGNDLTHATGCTYKTAIQNGLSVARFDGSTQNLGPTTVTQAQPITILAVMKSDVTTATNRVVIGSSTNVSVLGNDTSGSPDTWIQYSGNAYQLHTVTTSWAIMAAVSNNASSRMYLNGGTTSVGTSGANAWNNWRIGSYDGASQFWDGDIGEVLVYTGVLSLADLNTLGDYLAAKWGLTWTTVTA